MMFTTVLLVYTFSLSINSETIVCDGGESSSDCTSQTLSCILPELCTIRCQLDVLNATEYSVCHNSTINCKEGYNCKVECDAGSEACKGITIYAQSATALDVISNTDSAYNMSQIYCPISGSCTFTAIPLNTEQAFLGVSIYSKNGFNDNTIDLQCTNADCAENARISCTEDYSESCFIDINNDALEQNTCTQDHVCGTLSTFSDPIVERSSTCNGWEITVTFTLTAYNKTNSNWKQLETVFMNAFIQTILNGYNNKWNDKWCYDVKDMMRFDNITFVINNRLYSDYFLNHKSNVFIDKCKQYLTENIYNLTMQQGVYTSQYTFLQTEGPHDDKRNILNISLIVIFASCCMGSIYTVCRCWAYEKTVDETDTGAKSIAKKDNISTSEPKEVNTKTPASNTDKIVLNIDTEVQGVPPVALETIRSQSESEQEEPSTEPEAHGTQTEQALNKIFEVIMSEDNLHDGENMVEQNESD